MFDNTFLQRIQSSQHLSSLNDISEMKEAVEMLVLPIKALLGHYIFHFVRKCPCGYCNCMYCNVLHNSPHETEVGTNSIEAMTRDGYWF